MEYEMGIRLDEILYEIKKLNQKIEELEIQTEEIKEQNPTINVQKEIIQQSQYDIKEKE